MKANKANIKRVKTEFGPETQFDVHPVPAVSLRVAVENCFEDLKSRLVEERLKQCWDFQHASGVRQAAHEAEALAWVTPYPALVFPVLFEEKSEAAHRHAERQDEVHRRSRELLAV